MKLIKIADKTLRENAAHLTFKEKIDVAKKLDSLKIDIIETPEISNGKKDILYLHTISSIVKNSTISCPVTTEESSILEAYDAIKTAKKPRLNIEVSVSTVQMEYMHHKKPDKMLECVKKAIACATSVCADVEISLIDATRAEKDFMYKIAAVCAESGVKTINVCDTAGIMLPAEFEDYIKDLYKNVPSLKDVILSVECSNLMSMGVASAIASVNVGAKQLKVCTGSTACPSLKSLINVFRMKENVLDIKTSVNMTVLDNAVSRISSMVKGGFAQTNQHIQQHESGYPEEVKFSKDDDIKTIEKAISDIGYDLPADDIKNVYDEFLKIAAKKVVGFKELDAIVASTAMQVAPTFKLKSYVINSGNVISPTANIELVRNDSICRGICSGDGPIDAAFKAVEQVVGHHYELDDFQIQSVTRGHEAMGESVVKLRADGKLYSGKGTSTDIVEASINAYINAINKIFFEENM